MRQLFLENISVMFSHERIKVEITASLFRSKIFVNFSESECSLKLIITKSETEYHIRKNPVESSHS